MEDIEIEQRAKEYRNATNLKKEIYNKIRKELEELKQQLGEMK